MIDLTGIDKAAFAKAVYAISDCKGLGFLQMQAGPLSDEEAEEIASADEFHMDYVHGKCCKMFLREEDGKLTADDSWYDHTDTQYRELLSQFGLSMEHDPVHGCSCECAGCQSERRAVVASTN